MAAWKNWLNSLPSEIGVMEHATIEDLRADVLAALTDCAGPMCERMRWRIECTDSAQDLWLLRGELFQLIAAAHCQSVATSRINSLLPAFEGWLPRKMLTSI